jgi:hypothetical protein
VLPPQTFALDLLHDLLSEWGIIFRSIPQFESLLVDSICPTVKTLLRSLQEDYLASAVKNGLAAATALTTRVIRVARVLLLEYATLSSRILSEVDLMVTLMLHSMQPYRGDIDPLSSTAEQMGYQQLAGKGAAAQIRNQLLGIGMSIGMSMGLGAAAPSSSSGKVAMPDDGSSSGGINAMSSSVVGGLLTVGRPRVGGDLDSSNNGGYGRIPSHPVGCCLEALLSFFLLCDSEEGEGKEGETGRLPWTCFVSSAMINVVMSASAVITGGLAVDSNLQDFRKSLTGAYGSAIERVINLLEAPLSESTDSSCNNCSDMQLVVRSLYEYVHVSGTPLSSNEVIVLAFLLTQVITRLM